MCVVRTIIYSNFKLNKIELQKFQNYLAYSYYFFGCGAYRYFAILQNNDGA